MVSTCPRHGSNRTFGRVSTIALGGGVGGLRNSWPPGHRQPRRAVDGPAQARWVRNKLRARLRGADRFRGSGQFLARLPRRQRGVLDVEAGRRAAFHGFRVSMQARRLSSCSQAASSIGRAAYSRFLASIAASRAAQYRPASSATLGSLSSNRDESPHDIFVRPVVRLKTLNGTHPSLSGLMILRLSSERSSRMSIRCASGELSNSSRRSRDGAAMYRSRHSRFDIAGPSTFICRPISAHRVWASAMAAAISSGEAWSVARVDTRTGSLSLP